MPQEIEELADTILHNPAKVSVTPPATTVEAIEQSVYFVDKENKRRLLIHLLQNPEIESALVFTRTKHGADRVVRELKKANIQAAAIHGDKSQNARQKALGDFKQHKTRVLVATDIAARGIDIEELSHVITTTSRRRWRPMYTASGHGPRMSGIAFRFAISTRRRTEALKS
ncbi:MAG: helicase-related protein [Anaeromassilibacillus sp.]